MIMLTSGACDRNAAHFPAAPSGRSPLSPSAFPKKLRSIALQVLVWTFACSTGQLQAEGITPGLRVFDVTWSGASFQNSAVATARITFDPTLLQPSITDGTNWVEEFTITVSGATAGNGTWTKEDFGDIQIRTGDDPLDFTRELVGQYGFGSRFEPFKAFKFAGPTPGAPQSDGQFVIRCGGNFGQLLRLTSFKPAAGSSLLELQSAFSEINGGLTTGRVYALAEDSRGRLIAGGSFDQRAYQLARFLPNGEMDHQFGSTGIVEGHVADLLVLPDDSIVAVGDFTAVTYEGNSMKNIVKTFPDGRIDPSFASGLGADAAIRSIKRQPDGKYIIGGQFTQYDGISRDKLARLMPDGSPDPTFMTGGGFGSANDYVDEIQLLDGGLVMIAGQLSSYAGHNTRHVARLLSNGNVDPTFRSTQPMNSVETMRVLKSGKILIGGSGRRLIRLNTDGTVDSSFSPTFTGSVVYGVLELPGGRTMVSGLISSPEGEGFSNLMVLNSDGSVYANAFYGTIRPNDLVGPLLAGAQGNFYIGGAFSEINGQAYGRLAKFSDFTADFQFEAATGTIMEGGYQDFHVTVNDSLTAPAEFEITVEADEPGILPMIYVHPTQYAYPGQMKTQIHVGFADDSEINEPRTFRLRMTSLTAGASVGTPDVMTIRVVDNDIPESPPFRVWAGDQALLNGSDPPVNLEPTLVGETSSITFTLTNDDFSDLTLAPIILSLGNTGNFLIGTPASTTIAPGSSTTFAVTFAPKTPGTKTATIQVLGTGAGNIPFDIGLAGIATTPPQPEIVVEQPEGSGLTNGAAKKSFGTVRVGWTGTTRTFTIKNIGTAPLTGFAISKHGKHRKDFIVSRPTKSTLAPGASLTFKVKFKPRALKTRSASIRIRSNDEDENPFEIDLSGFGAGR